MASKLEVLRRWIRSVASLESSKSVVLKVTANVSSKLVANEAIMGI